MFGRVCWKSMIEDSKQQAEKNWNKNHSLRLSKINYFEPMIDIHDTKNRAVDVAILVVLEMRHWLATTRSRIKLCARVALQRVANTVVTYACALIVAEPLHYRLHSLNGRFANNQYNLLSPNIECHIHPYL